jgi:hypothetical protein
MFIATALQLFFRICQQEGRGKPGGTEIKWGKSAALHADDMNLLGDDIDTLNKNTESLIDTSKKVSLEVNTEKTKYMLLSLHQNAGRNS